MYIVRGSPTLNENKSEYFDELAQKLVDKDKNAAISPIAPWTITLSAVNLRDKATPTPIPSPVIAF